MSTTLAEPPPTALTRNRSVVPVPGASPAGEQVAQAVSQGDVHDNEQPADPENDESAHLDVAQKRKVAHQGGADQHQGRN